MMNIEHLLENWVKARLIDQKQAESILQYEQDQPSASWVIFGLCSLGVIVAMTGVISIIAANWDSISPFTKLTAYFVSLVLLAAGVVRYRNSATPLKESLLTAFGLYVLAGIGLIGQIYSIESDGYSAIFFWLAIILPVVLSTRGQLLNNIWFIGFAIGISLWNVSNFDKLPISSASDRFAFSAALPYFFLALGYGLDHLLSPYYCRAARFWSFVTLLIPYALAGNFLWIEGSLRIFLEESRPSPILPLFGAALAVAATVLRKTQPGRLLTRAICFTIAISVLLTIFPFIRPIGEHEIVGCGLFLLAWGGAATIAAAIQRKGLFDFAATIIGVRFIVVYFEVFGSLAATGAGLIISGGVILGIAWLWYRYRGKFASAIREAA